MTRLSLLIVALMTFTGCVQPATALFKLDEPFWVRVEHSVQIERLSVRFVRVIEDSRCPIDVVCVWEGNAQVELELQTQSASPAQMTLNSMLAPTELEYAGYRVRYLDLEPRPCTRCRLNPKEYRLKLIVSRSAPP
ncbi:MAG: hypothetical protein NZ610_04320 [Candidatus Bipolaricaulota bacterium]|nr:hypothetical protein [Candidatus Bipolaricaulota bacterium]MCS7274615.1 hypothetical protein [Candidatus Bipolaricaulota bacterium]MDW8110954.1 hypothetical protein [Candidatus Bipolaricaulota bacterium]MDW8329045.1 hypothetical protein [Candidatus Bipolaricaulota bacterium]